MSDSWKAPGRLKKSRPSESNDKEQHAKQQEETRATTSKESAPRDRNSEQISAEATRHKITTGMPQMAQTHLYDPDFQRQQLQQLYQHQLQPPFQQGPWTGMPQTQIPCLYNPYNNQMLPMYGSSQYLYPQPLMLSGLPVVLDQSSSKAAATEMEARPKTREEQHHPESVASNSKPKRPRLSKDDTSKNTSDITETQKTAMRLSKKIIEASLQTKINKLSKYSTEKQQREQSVTRSDRKEKKNAQSRARAAKLREKISEVKGKPDELITDEEMKLLQIFEGRRQKKNDRSKERAIEKKIEIERILAIAESKRTPEDANALDVFMKSKQKKNEGDRIRREQIKSSIVRKKSLGVRGRPRKYSPGDSKPKQGTVASSESSSGASNPTASQSGESTSTNGHVVPTKTISFAGPQGSLISSHYYSNSKTRS